MAKDHDILRTVVDWAKTKEDIRGVALVGSHARDQARRDSDIDLVLLTEHPDDFRNAASLTTIDWSGAGVHPMKWTDEEYGVVWCRRICFKPDFKLEVAFAPLSWSDVSPVDKGTERVVSDGCRVLYDPDGLLKRLTLAVARL
jgi:predicted nucleotidyltransferase